MLPPEKHRLSHVTLKYLNPRKQSATAAFLGLFSLFLYFFGFQSGVIAGFI
jgi:hypothetical protein